LYVALVYLSRSMDTILNLQPDTEIPTQYAMSHHRDESELRTPITITKPTEMCSHIVHLSAEDFEQKISTIPQYDNTCSAIPSTEPLIPVPQLIDGAHSVQGEIPLSDTTRSSLDHNSLQEPILPEWPEEWKDMSFTETIQNSLDNHVFSTAQSPDLLISVPQLVDTVDGIPGRLYMPWLGIAIMAGDEASVNQILQSEEMKYANDNLSSVFPFHLAVAYLNSDKSCCQIFSTLVCFLGTSVDLRPLYIDEFGHTILDSLMVTILKSHSRAIPGDVDSRWVEERSFPGAEVDICGRRDANSENVRALIRNGLPVVPFDWKHKFCHTSTQAICHCIRALFAFSWAPDINTPSGLFQRRCTGCGQQLTMGPLHTLVMTAANLAIHACPDEDLSGMVACALCLLSNGADPTAQYHISHTAFDTMCGYGSTARCDHTPLRAGELASQIETVIVARSMRRYEAVSIGWRLLRCIINSAEDSAMNCNDGDNMVILRDNDRLIIDCTNDASCHTPYFGHNMKLATLWAIVQSEFLTYRRGTESNN
jgi:hypothetical protein